jgi:F-type H+-transporting ATPase subunit gamma
MANLGNRNRITSVSSTMQITSAMMKMVSAAKLKKAQDAITAMRPYAEKMTELLQNLSLRLMVQAVSSLTNEIKF